MTSKVLYAIITEHFKFRPVGQAVKTPPFHGDNRGSIPLRVTTSEQSSLCSVFLCRKTSACFLAPPLPQKARSVRLFACKRAHLRLTVATTFFRYAPYGAVALFAPFSSPKKFLLFLSNFLNRDNNLCYKFIFFPMLGRAFEKGKTAFVQNLYSVFFGIFNKFFNCLGKFFVRTVMIHTYCGKRRYFNDIFTLAPIRHRGTERERAGL